MTLRRGAALETLAVRAELLTRIRSWFVEHPALEVETASLSEAATPDPAILSMRASGRLLSGFLHTSPEYMMKRLVAEGSGDIYQLCRVWRDGESGRWHEPEFTLLEWYRIGIDEFALMDEVEALLVDLLGRDRLPAPSVRLGYDEALERALGLGSRADSASLEEALIDRGIAIPSECGHGALLDLAMSTVVSPGFRGDALTFVHGYPADQAALARIRNTDPPSAARFEVFLGALELGNGFCELTDAKEQRRRFTRENGMRVAAGLDPVPLDEPFLESLSRGLPDCSGVALGFDRIVAAATHAASIADVVAFTHSRLSP